MSSHHPRHTDHRNIALIAVVLIIIIALLVWYLVSRNNRSSLSTYNELTTSSGSVVDTETATWPLQENPAFGYSFKLPSDWQRKDWPDRVTGPVLVFQTFSLNLPEATTAPVDLIDTLILQVVDRPFEKVLEDQQNLENLSRSTILLPTNKSITKLSGIWPRDSLYSERRQLYFAAPLGGRTLLLGLQTAKTGNPDLESLVSKIATTLMF